MATSEGAKPDERYVNQSKFAKLKTPPVTRQAIRKALDDGKLILHGTGRAGRIDLECPLTKAYLVAATNPGKATGPAPPKAKQKKSAKATPPSPPANNSPKEDMETTPPDAPSNAVEVQDFMDNEKIKRLKLQEQLEKLKLHNMEKRNELISRDLVQAFVHQMHEIDNGQWGTLDLKIASDLGAALEIEDDVTIRKMADVVKREVKAILKQVKRDQNRFLKTLGAKKIPKGKAA